VRLAANHGLHKTARALHLDYNGLKKRLDGTASVRPEPVPSFVELVRAAPAGLPECVVELEGRSGTRLRIHFKGTAGPDLEFLGRLFWGGER